MESNCKFYIKAENFFNKGKFENATRCCKKSIESNPKNYMAYCILGLISKNRGNIGDAFAYFKKSLEINPQYIDGINNLGAIYNDNNMKKEAEECFRKAINLYPNYPEANYNLANVLTSNGKLDEAIEYYKKAIELRGDYYDACVNLANILFDKGQLDEAEKYYKNCIENCSKSDKDVAILNYGYLLMYKYGIGSWRDVVTKNISSFVKGGIYEAEAKLCIEVANWVLGDVAVNIDNVKKTYEVSKRNPLYLNNKDIRSYCNILNNLDAFYKRYGWDNYEPSKILYLVGDSHTLTCSNKVIDISGTGYRCKTELIRGCKIWHLVNNEPNKFKVAYNRIMKSIPSKSDIVMSFGEIDCRTNEGIFYRYLKYGKDWSEESATLIERYFLQVIKPLKEVGHNLYIWGVPAPHKDRVSSELHVSRQSEYVDFIGYFNEKLKQHSLASNVLYVDNYSITNDENGMSDYKTHLDFAHLTPKTYIKAIVNVSGNNATQGARIYNKCNL